MYANGYFLTKAYDYTFTNLGKIGSFVRAATDQPFTVLFDDLKVWLLDDTYYPPQVIPPTYPPITVPPPATNALTVTANVNVNVRSGPGTQYPSYGVAPIDATGEVIGVSQDGQWWLVKLPVDVSLDGQGWGNTNYVTVSNAGKVPVVPAWGLPEVEVPPAPPGTPTATAIEPINVRSGPGSKYTSYGVASIGSEGEVIGVSEDGTWRVMKISTDVAPDGIDWVRGAYVVVVNGENVPVIPAPPIL